MTFTFYLGVHRPCWLPLTDVPLFVSVRTLRARRTIPKAKGRVAFDSAGFTELQLHGGWTIDDRQLASDVRRAQDAVGRPDFAAIRDWMCEPFMLAKTGKTIAEHQRLTIASYVALRELAPEIAWLPVLQGWHADDYEAHAEMYATWGGALSYETSIASALGPCAVARRPRTGPRS